MSSTLSLTGLALNLTVTAGAVLTAMLILWRVGVKLADSSIIDMFWGPGLGLIAAITWLLADGAPARRHLVTALTLIWAVRLGLHIYTRNAGHGEDPRYTNLRNQVISAGRDFDRYALIHVFLAQGVVMWLVSLPVQLAQYVRVPDALGPWAWAGAALWLTGFLFETIGDLQLARFKADPANAGTILNRGLWRYTRHPNYFGDACVWWGLFLITCDHVLGWITVLSPLLMTKVLVSWTGKAVLERNMTRKHQAYADYVARTSGFIPWPPKR
jgi:steroid 5-alpha reductase family enzyme